MKHLFTLFALLFLAVQSHAREMATVSDALYAVTFAVNGVETEKNVVLLDASGAIVTERQLAPGNYAAVLTASSVEPEEGYDLLCNDTIRFEVKNAPVHIDFSDTPADYHKVEIDYQNLPEGTTTYALTVDGYGDYHSKLMLRNGIHACNISLLYGEDRYRYILTFAPADHVFTVSGKDIAITPELPTYRLLYTEYDTTKIGKRVSTPSNIRIYNEKNEEFFSSYGPTFRRGYWAMQPGAYRFEGESDGTQYYAQFTVKATDDTVKIPLSRIKPGEVYPEVRVSVKDVDGTPGSGFKVQLSGDLYVSDEFTTSADGTAAVPVPAAGEYKVSVVDANGCYLPYTATVEAPEEGNVEHTASFEDYGLTRVIIKGVAGSGYTLLSDINWYNSYGISGLLDSRSFTVAEGYFPEDGIFNLYAPEYKSMSAYFTIQDEKGRTACKNNSWGYSEETEEYIFDFTGYQPVTIMLNGEEISQDKLGNSNIDLYYPYFYGESHPNQPAPLWFKSSELLLPTEKYKAIYHRYYTAVLEDEEYSWDFVANDTIDFEIKDAPVSIAFNDDIEKTHKVVFEIDDYEAWNSITAQLGGVKLRGFRPYWGRHFLLKDGHHDLHFSLYHNSWQTSYKYAMEAHVRFTVNGEDKTIPIDISDLRNYVVTFDLSALAWGNSWTWNSFVVTDENGHSEALYGIIGVEMNILMTLRPGQYTVEATGMNNEKCYGSFSVSADGPTELKVVMTTDPTGIDEAVTSALDVAASEGQLTVKGNEGREISLNVTDMGGRRVFSAATLNGERLSPALPRGVYVVSLEQGTESVTKKVVF